MAAIVTYADVCYHSDRCRPDADNSNRPGHPAADGAAAVLHSGGPPTAQKTVQNAREVGLLEMIRQILINFNYSRVLSIVLTC